jgi:hypothetical protein
MPQFSVTLEEVNAPNPTWSRVTLRVNAVSAKHAMKKAERKLIGKYVASNQLFVAKSARRYSTDHQYWKKIWRKAYDNMPTRINVQKLEQWHEQEPGSTTLPDFIKGSAHGTMRHGQDGTVLKKVVIRRAHRMGPYSALTRLLEYARFDGRQKMRTYTVYQAMANGSRPNTEKRRKLLLKLAGPDGTRIAAEMLGRRFQPLKIKGKK